MKTITFFALAFLLAQQFAAGAEDNFAKANAEFAAGNFKYAINDYQTAVDSGDWSPNLFYDLGNAHYRDADPGRAILNYERSLQLDPRHPEAEANLRIAREEARALELPSTRAEKYFEFATINQLAIAAAILFWLALLLLVWRASGWTIAGAICLFIATGVSIFGAMTQENAQRGKAIVIAAGAEARVATADSARGVLALPVGSEVRILQERGDWNYADLPNGQRGWIAANATAKVRL